MILFCFIFIFRIAVPNGHNDTGMLSEISESHLTGSHTDTIIFTDRTILNDENVKYWIWYYEIQFPEVALRQIRIESNNYKSNICLNNNNITGMRYPRKRYTTATGKNFNHAVYNNWIDCIWDYRLYQDWYSEKILKCKSEADYYRFLKRYYCKTKGYESACKSIKL